MGNKTKTVLLATCSLLFLILIIIIMFVIPFPYGATETYTEEEPYEAVEAYVDTVKTVSNEPYSEDAKYLLEHVKSDKGFGPWGCGKTDEYIMTNLENETVCFTYTRTLYVSTLEMCEANNEKICFRPNEKKPLNLHLAYGYCSNSRMGCPEDTQFYSVKPKFISVPRVVRYRTIENTEEIEKNRTVTKYRAVTKKRPVTRHASLFDQMMGKK